MAGVYRVADEEGTAAFARDLARQLVAGDVVHLTGELGAGKTVLVRHAAAALGVTEPVTSPSFAVAHAYVGRAAGISHIDLYRSRGVSVEEAADLDVYLAEDRIVFVEWPEVGLGILPDPTVVVEIEVPDGGGRVFRLGWIRARGSR